MIVITHDLGVVAEVADDILVMYAGRGAEYGPATEIFGRAAHPSGLDYPSLRQLPLLGVTYADLFRRARIQESVFEYLTKQYEMARVEEVRAVPNIKVLDVAAVPERKSFPPRTLLIIFGTLLAVVGAAGWLIWSTRWQMVDVNDPRKVLLNEVFQTVRSEWKGGNGEVTPDGNHRPAS